MGCWGLFQKPERDPEQVGNGEHDNYDYHTLDDFLPGGWFDFDYLGHLTEGLKLQSDDEFDDRIFGLFRPVAEEDLQRLEQDPVPNRHAAMHGYVSYSSPQNSLNAIFVADYMFRLISSFRNDQTTSG